MKTIETKVARNIAAGALTGFGLMCFACFVCLELVWARTSPNAPAPLLGLIYPHNEHGWISYFSAFQATSCYLLFFIWPIFFLVGFAVAPKKNIKVKSGHFSWSMKFDEDDPRKMLRRSQLAGAVAAPIFVFTLGRVLVTLLVNWGLVLNLG